MEFKDYYIELSERVGDPAKIRKCQKIVDNWLETFAIRAEKRLKSIRIEIPPKLCGLSVNIFQDSVNRSRDAQITPDAINLNIPELVEIYKDYLNALQLHEQAETDRFLPNARKYKDVLVDYLKKDERLKNILFHETVHWADKGYLDLSGNAANAKFEKEKIRLTKNLMGWPTKKSEVSKKEVETYLKDVETSKRTISLNSPHELNAYFLTAFNQIKDKKFQSFDEMKTKFIWAYGPSKWDFLIDENRRRQLKRLYTAMDAWNNSVEG